VKARGDDVDPGFAREAGHRPEEAAMTPPPLDATALTPYLSAVLGRPVAIRALRPLGDGPGHADPKGFGYGVPFEVECVVNGAARSFVVSRTRPAQGFGHDYPADRAWQAIYGHHAYNSFPRHARSVDVGVVRASGHVDSVADVVEFFQLVEKAAGDLYWLDLERLLRAPAREVDWARVEALALFLASVHRTRRDEPTLYQRRIRELIGHGECLMGILDSYPHPYAFLPAIQCEAIEREAVSWRWRLRGRAHRLSRVHGDFHPWNLLFRNGTDFTALDRSRGEWGEPADDVSALGVNYLFYALRAQATPATEEAAPIFMAMFRRFLDAYLAASGDHELLEVVPPFLAFRALVIAHPRWYPDLAATTRAALISLADRLMASRGFDAAVLPEFSTAAS
jgi:aminoglycoside phosphotransferase (APT) family kinase protein